MLVARFHPAYGGVENQSLLLSRSLAKLDCDVTVITRRLPGTARMEVIEGVRVIRVSDSRGGRMGAGAAFLVGAVRTLLGEDFDVFHCHQAYSPATAAVLSSLVRSRPVIVKITASGILGEVGAMKALPFFSVRRRLLQRADVFIALNDEIEEELRSIGIYGAKIRRIPNGVVMPGTQTHEPQRHFERSLLFVGRLAREKRLDVALDALALLRKDDPRVGLVIVGDGGGFRAVDEDLRRRAAEIGVSQFVKFVGRVADPSAYYRGADVFLQLSESEGLSNALLEAMANGLPSVATLIPGNDVFSDGVAGYRVPVGDSQAVAVSAARILNNVEIGRAMSVAAREVITSRYSIERVADQYRELYDELTRGVRE